jgi:hypothetical protein
VVLVYAGSLCLCSTELWVVPAVVSFILLLQAVVCATHALRFTSSCSCCFCVSMALPFACVCTCCLAAGQPCPCHLHSEQKCGAADANILINQCRVAAQRYLALYGEPMPCEQLVKLLCDLKQAYTQSGGKRPFGVSLIYAGWCAALLDNTCLQASVCACA